MHAILALLAAILATTGMAAIALSIAVFIDALPLREAGRILDQPGRAAEIFFSGLSMLGLATAVGAVAALLERLDRIARALEDVAQNRRIP